MSKTKKILSASIILILLSILWAKLPSNAKENILFQKEGTLIIHPSNMHDSLFFDIELAQSNDEMMQGLMYREEMAPNNGMLFIYPEVREMSFWMKNTHLPLDLMFISQSGIILDLAEHAEPFSEESIYSSQLSKYVLEVNAGFCEENFIIIGDSLSWKKDKSD